MKIRAVKQQLAGMALPQAQPAPDQLQRWIAEAAYYRAQRRGFAPGQELEDWLAAEVEVLARVRADERMPA